MTDSASRLLQLRRGCGYAELVVAVVVFVLFSGFGRGEPVRHNPGGAGRGVSVWWCSGWPIRRRNTWTRYAPPMPATARLR